MAAGLVVVTAAGATAAGSAAGTAAGATAAAAAADVVTAAADGSTVLLGTLAVVNLATTSCTTGPLGTVGAGVVAAIAAVAASAMATMPPASNGTNLFACKRTPWEMGAMRARDVYRQDGTRALRGKGKSTRAAYRFRAVSITRHATLNQK